MYHLFGNQWLQCHTYTCARIQTCAHACVHTRPDFFCDIVVLELICYRTRANRLKYESNTTGGLKKFGRVGIPPKFCRPFLPTVPLQYGPKMLFTQATIVCLTIYKTKNALHKETVILNYNGGDPISCSLSN